MCLKGYEKESFLKSFLLFFLSMSLLMATVLYTSYQQEMDNLDEKLLDQMRICNFDLKCEGFKLDFVPFEHSKAFTLKRDTDGVYAVFAISGASKEGLEIRLDAEAYGAKRDEVFQAKAVFALLLFLAITLLSFLFSIYALSPLRKALNLTEEFVKDILHDFNTPLATLRLNSAMLKSEVGENTKLARIEMGVQTMLDLQENLRAYLEEHVLYKETFSLNEMLMQRIEILEKSYASLHFVNSVPPCSVHTNPLAFQRIIDNLLSNAAKYNKADGEVEISLKDKILSIRDTGQGIAHPDKVFERFYKEHERGLGIGLHIVKKLCEAMELKIWLESSRGEGSTFFIKIAPILLEGE